MKRAKKLVLLLLVLVLLAGATAAVKRTAKDTADLEEPAVTVFALNPDSVTHLGWYYSEKVSFTAGESGWVCDQDAAFPVDETYLTAMLDALAEVTSTKTIKAPENLDQYGLEVPVCKITVSDGTEHTLSIGLETAMGGQRYFSNGDGNVYLVADSLLDSFQYGLYDVLKDQTLPQVANLSGLTVKTSGGGYTITRQDGSGLTYSDDYVWFLEGKPLDNERTDTLLSTVTSLNLQRCVDYNADDLSQYGLDTPSVTATVLDGGNEAFTLEIGNTDGDSCYLRLKDSKMIYQVDAALSDTLRYTTYVDLQPDDVLLMDWDTVKRVSVVLDGSEYPLVSGEDDAGGTVWKKDGETVEFASVLDTLTSMDSNGFAAGLTPEGEPQITFRIFRERENFSQVTLCFYAYNSTSCLVTLDGASTVTVRREDAANLIASVRDLLE